jgi:hypothetical protein
MHAWCGNIGELGIGVAAAFDLLDLHPELSLQGLGSRVVRIIIIIIFIPACQETIMASAAFTDIDQYTVSWHFL